MLVATKESLPLTREELENGIIRLFCMNCQDTMRHTPLPRQAIKDGVLMRWQPNQYRCTGCLEVTKKHALSNARSMSAKRQNRDRYTHRYTLTEMTKKVLIGQGKVLQCAKCNLPICVGDRVLAKRKYGNSNHKLYHEPCWEALFF